MMMNGGNQHNVPFPGGSPYGQDFQRPPPHVDTHRRRTSSGPQHTTPEPSYFPQPQQRTTTTNNNNNGFQPPTFSHQQYSSSPGSSPSRRPSNLPPQQQQQQQQQQHQPPPPPSSNEPQTGAGFHPYRRPDRRGAGSSSRDPSSSPAPPPSQPEVVLPPSRPYVRTEVPGSNSSVASTNSGSKSDGKRRVERERERERERAKSPTTTTAQAAGNGPPPSSSRAGQTKVDHSRHASHSSSDRSSGGSISSLGAVVPRITTTGTARRESFSSERGSIVQSGNSSPTSSSTNNSPTQSNHRPNSPSGGNSSTKAPPKPSPLSQRQPIVREPEQPKPVVVATPTPPAPTPTMVKSGGLMGRLKGKLGNDDEGKKKKDLGKGKPSSSPVPSPSGSSLPTSKSSTQLRSVSSPAAPPSSSSTGPLTPSQFQVRDETTKASDGKGKRSMFNMKNASTDNISIASAASSASMMIRKIGNFGKLAKRNSLMGISNMFKDKKGAIDDDDFEPGDKKKKGGLFKSRKSDASTAAVTHFSAELDRSPSSTDDQPVTGLSPAAKLARQHTLRSKAEEAAAASARNARRGGGGGPLAAVASVDEQGRRPSIEVPPVWDKNTVTRNGAPVEQRQEEEQQAWRRDEGRPTSEDDASFGPSDDDGHGGYDEEDAPFDEMTSRMGGVGFSDQESEIGGEFSSWGTAGPAPGKVPVRSILKAVSSYDTPLETPDAVWTRARSNSSDQQMANSSLSLLPQPTPPNALTRIPSGDRENIDGLPLTSSKATSPPSSSPPATSSYPDPLAPGYSPFENANETEHDPEEISPAEKRMSFPYANPAHNSSAPALSQFSGPGGAMNHRAMTAPLGKKKELVWAPNCAVYHTFHGSEYDRRSEPATCNRLTPQLAQEIKAFLNQYKLEEMEVHPSSRAYTQFFG
ncbi:hypothetical protein BDY24DRAFT_204682 [Mrakia frigida]|uniref:uncharacterized protein n=1 Tax=Mrakia frigida TaxID=29902 RepID=UPI003FCC05E6